MKESTIIRIVELICGLCCIAIYAYTGVDNVLLLIAAFCFGVPLEVIHERRKEDAEKEKAATAT